MEISFSCTVQEGAIPEALRAELRTSEPVKSLTTYFEGRLPIVGVGGIMDADGAWAALRSGASLVQVYTGFVYGGPAFPRSVLRGLGTRLDDARLGSIAEVVGSDV